jgi:hypothetical protein
MASGVPILLQPRPNAWARASSLTSERSWHHVSIMTFRAALGQLAILGCALATSLAPSACSSSDDNPGPVPAQDGAAPLDVNNGPRLHFDDPMFSTGSLCHEDRSLTYDTFARDFFASYCTRCHGSDKVGMGARNAAPSDHNFDTLAGVQRWLPNIDIMAAAGPKAEHMDMPPSSPKPTDEERQKLGAWLACREGL